MQVISFSFSHGRPSGQYHWASKTPLLSCEGESISLLRKYDCSGQPWQDERIELASLDLEVLIGPNLQNEMLKHKALLPKLPRQSLGPKTFKTLFNGWNKNNFYWFNYWLANKGIWVYIEELL